MRPRRAALWGVALLLGACATPGADPADVTPEDTATPDVAEEVTSGEADVTPSDATPTPEETQGEAPTTTWHEDCPLDVREQRSLEVGDITLNVACRGAGPTVVFLHGFPEFHFAWDKVMDALAGEFRLIAPDQRGYNTSSKPPEVASYALPALVEDIMTLLPMVSPEPVILVAHDWGGPVGWLVAHDPAAHLRGFMATNGPHPLRIAELLESDPAQQEASSYMDFFRTPLATDYLSVEVLREMFADVLSDEDLAIYEAAWSQPGAIDAGLNWYRANDLSVGVAEDLLGGSTVTVPTTVLWGLADEALLPQNAEGLEAYVDDLQVETFEGVDHWIEHRIPEAVAQAIRDLHARIGP